MNRIKVGDKVKVMTGSLKGNVAEVEKIKNNKVYLKGLKVVERHFKATQFNQGGKRDVHLGVDISNVSLVVDGEKTSKVSFLVKDSGKVRVAKLNSKEIK